VDLSGCDKYCTALRSTTAGKAGLPVLTQLETKQMATEQIQSQLRYRSSRSHVDKLQLTPHRTGTPSWKRCYLR